METPAKLRARKGQGKREVDSVISNLYRDIHLASFDPGLTVTPTSPTPMSTELYRMGASISAELTLKAQATRAVIEKADLWDTLRNESYTNQEESDQKELVHTAVQKIHNGPGIMDHASSIATAMALERERYGRFGRKHGIMMLALCAHSSAFREACYRMPPNLWTEVSNVIKENAQSLEMFAKVRGLDWTAPLAAHFGNPLQIIRDNALFGFGDYLLETLDVKRDHPHHWLVSAQGIPRQPTFEGHVQENIKEDMFNPDNWDAGYDDPTLRRPELDGECDACGSTDLCQCTMSAFPEILVELHEYPDKGVGVRALAPIEAGAILGQYMGEIVPWDTDINYQLEHRSKTAVDGSADTFISPKRYGNWTRFMNHSCDANVSFVPMTVGLRTVAAIKAVRDIQLLEEITVNYGQMYFENLGLECKCGSRKCKFKGKKAGTKRRDSTVTRRRSASPSPREPRSAE